MYIRTRKLLISKKENMDHKNNLNKIKILVMNSITFKIPITFIQWQSKYGSYVNVIHRIHYQYLHLV